jgi:hypothetical protein
MSERISYEYTMDDKSAASPAIVSREVAAIWKDLQTEGSDGRNKALAAGFTVDMLSLPISEVLTITPSKAAIGIDLMTVLITVAVSGATTVGSDVWSTIILPLLQKKAGVKVLTPKRGSKVKASGAKGAQNDDADSSNSPESDADNPSGSDDSAA